MHRKYIILIAGSILLVAGISITAISYSSTETWLRDQNVLIENGVILPNESYSAEKVLKAGQNMQLAIHYPLFGAPINAKIKDPNGIVVSDINSTSYDRELSTTFTPEISGEYTVTITNHGTESVPVHTIFGNIQNQGENKNPFK